MRQSPWRLRMIVLSVLVLAYFVGCAVERGKVYVKDGQRYGVTSRNTWRDSWWDYYERGTSYASGEFWDEAMADFHAAMAQRQDDQRRARTYGLHLIDYFPHRELGVVYYRLNRQDDAIRELETSLDSEATAKAKFYLNKARKSHLQQTGGDVAPPRIVLDTPRDGLLTNRFSVRISGQAEDDTYVAAIAVDGRAQFIELAEPRRRFTQEIALHDGVNSIDIVAHDLVGRQSRKRLTVHLDRHGPLVSLDEVEMLGTPPRVRVHGLLADYSRITRFVLAGRQIPLQPGTTWEFRQEVFVMPGATSLPFEVEDAAGNITRGDIDLTASESALPGTRHGRSAIRLLPRWVRLFPGWGSEAVVTDLPVGHTAQLHAARRRDRQPPVIKLAGLEDRETIYDDTIYIEGRVTDASAIAAFAINGESLWRRKTRQLFFGQSIALQPGENALVLEAADEVGNRAQHTVMVHREIRQVKRVGSRLRVVILPFDKKGEASMLSEVVYDYLFNVMVSQRRFDFVERQRLEAILREHKLSRKVLADPATAARTGKIATAEGILTGMVTETPSSLEVFARFIDVETAVVLAAADVYGEDLTPRTLKTLMEGLAWKFQRHFPLVEGFVMAKEGEHITTDLSESQGIKRYMKLIVFRNGEELKHPRTGRLLRGPDTILGEARITAITADVSEATLLLSESTGKVQEADKVITK